MARPASPRVDDILGEIDSMSVSLGKVLAHSPTGQPSEIEVWLIYERCERAVAKLRYRLGSERPGVFTELPRSKQPLEFLSAALEGLGMARGKIQEGNFLDGLESLRSARTSLRAFLAEMGRARTREKRRAALSRRSSSTSS